MSSLNGEFIDSEFPLDLRLARWDEQDLRFGRWEAENHPEWFCKCGCFTGIPGVPCDCHAPRAASMPPGGHSEKS